jgi:hypothetical protein
MVSLKFVLFHYRNEIQDDMLPKSIEVKDGLKIKSGCNQHIENAWIRIAYLVKRLVSTGWP